ncbi:hypothetical protein NPIL_631701, partial [Nephila pilipes]
MHDKGRSPRWSVHAQNSAPCGCFWNHFVKVYDSQQKPG